MIYYLTNKNIRRNDKKLVLSFTAIRSEGKCTKNVKTLF